MTTRKALIERIQAMQLGTQEMLDAAQDDARLIPLATLFVDEFGNARWRAPCDGDDSFSVCMHSPDADWEYFSASELCPMTEE